MDLTTKYTKYTKSSADGMTSEWRCDSGVDFELVVAGLGEAGCGAAHMNDGFSGPSLPGDLNQ